MPYASVILADSPVAGYRLGEASGTVAADLTGTYAGTYVGSPTLAVAGGLTGDADTAATFNGTSQSVTIGALGSLGANAAGGVSIECLIKMTSVGRRSVVEFSGAALGMSLAVVTNQTAVLGSSAGALYVVLRDAGNHVLDGAANANTGFNNGSYHHLVVTIDPPGKAIAIYLDGVAQAITYNRQVTQTTWATFTGGSIATGPGVFNGGFLPGTLDEVSFYNAVLSPSQVTRHYNAVLGNFGMSAGLRSRLRLNREDGL